MSKVVCGWCVLQRCLWVVFVVLDEAVECGNGDEVGFLRIWYATFSLSWRELFIEFLLVVSGL